jgi:uncharacterized protein with von Willebrand factor type A (vWA) domain
MSAAAVLSEAPAAGVMLRRRAIAFLRLLRLNGFVVGPAEAADTLRLLAASDLSRAGDLRESLKALLCCRSDDWRRFDALFEAHWLGHGMKRAALVQGTPPKATAGLQRLTQGPGPQGVPDGLADHVERIADGAADALPGHSRRAGASAVESVAETDLRHLSDPEDLARAHALAERLSRRMRHRLTRRERLARKGRRLDIRATIHRSISKGGTPVDLAFRRRRHKPLAITVLLDVSGSMDQYAAFFLRFMHGVLSHFRRAEAFVFHTRLIHVAPALRERNPQKALDRLSLIAQGWSGGTRIGECLAAFNRHHAARVLGSRSVLVILSDGYDTGAPEQLERELAAVAKRTRRIVWLNPMAGWQGYEPAAAGMQAAMPHVDLFAPAHNLRSLEALEPYLARI